MSPRPRKASDAEVFAAAGRVMSRVGPSQLTLAEIASEAGLTPGALVQRFGSKRGLLVALSEEFAGSAPLMFHALRAERRSPLETVRAYSDCMAEMASSPGALAHHLSYLQVDITDPDLRRHLRTHARATRAELRSLLEDAVLVGELKRGTDTAALARAIEVTIGGSLLSWAVHQEGDARSWMRRDLEVTLGPYRAGRPTRGARRQPATRTARGAPPTPRRRSSR